MENNTVFASILDLIKAFPDEKTCIDHLEKYRWDGEVVSPFDETSKVYKCKKGRYRCKNTGKYFNVRTGTIFDNTKIKLDKWFLAIYISTSHKKGISSLQLSRDIDVTQKTAWHMLQRIRGVFSMDKDTLLHNEVEIDEAIVGGKNINRHKHKKVENAVGGNTPDKSIIMGILERGGKVIARKIPNRKYKTLAKEIFNNVDKSATIYTDEHDGYNQLRKDYVHKTVQHSSDEYVKGDAHTNGVEGFWSLLKRGIYGIYHYTSQKHLQRYVDEFAFRYNTRNHSTAARFNLFLANTEYKLTYKMLVNPKK